MEEAERFSYFLHWYSNQYSHDIEMGRISAQMLEYNISKLIGEQEKACILLRPYSNMQWGQNQNPQAWTTLGTQQTTLL